MTDIQKLKALAEAACPRDDWYEQGDLRYADDKTGETHAFHHHDAAFVEAASPAAVLELIEEIEVFRAMAAQPGSLNAMPSSDYDGLKRQFFALRNYALCKDKLAGYYSRELESLRSVDRSQSADEIDAERSINQQLTNDLLQVEGERDQLKAENEAMRKALTDVMTQVDGNIRETVRDCVNGHDDVQDIYGYCDSIEGIIDAAMSKEASHD